MMELQRSGMRPMGAHFLSRLPSGLFQGLHRNRAGEMRPLHFLACNQVGGNGKANDEMKTLMMAAVAAFVVIGMTGCGKSDRARFSEAMDSVITDKDEKARELESFDEMDAAEKRKRADFAEYFAILKKTSGGALDNRMIKKTVSKTFQGMNDAQRAEFLEKARAEMKAR